MRLMGYGEGDSFIFTREYHGLMLITLITSGIPWWWDDHTTVIPCNSPMAHDAHRDGTVTDGQFARRNVPLGWWEKIESFRPWLTGCVLFKHIQTIIYHCCYCEFYLVTLLLLLVVVVEAAIRVAVAVVYCNSSYSCCHYFYYHIRSKTIYCCNYEHYILLCSCYIWGFDATAYSQPFCRVYNKLSCRQISGRALTSRLATIGKPSLMQSTLSQFKSITCLSLSVRTEKVWVFADKMHQYGTWYNPYWLSWLEGSWRSWLLLVVIGNRTSPKNWTIQLVSN